MISFTIDADPIGGRVTVAGQDVTSQVAAAELRLGATEPTVLTLHEIAEGHVEGEGLVRVVGADYDAGKIVADWLGKIDPRALEQDAMKGSAVGESPTRRILACLIDHALASG